MSTQKEKNKMEMNSPGAIDYNRIASTLLASGDLHKDDCACGMEHGHDCAPKLEEVVQIALDAIAPFGAAGLRDLAYYATDLANEEEFRQATIEEQKKRRAEQEKFSEFDKLALLIAVGRVDGDILSYHRAADLVSFERYTSREICLLPLETLTKLLVSRR
jgi:hypothetical protein